MEEERQAERPEGEEDLKLWKRKENMKKYEKKEKKMKEKKGQEKKLRRSPEKGNQ